MITVQFTTSLENIREISAEATGNILCEEAFLFGLFTSGFRKGHLNALLSIRDDFSKLFDNIHYITS